MRSIYQDPKYYEIVFGKRNFKAESKAILQLVKEFSKIPILSILDIACGTGQHMTELSKRGIKVAGLDLSKKMITETKQNFQGNHNLIDLYQKDMTKFTLPRKFDACICMVNSLEILTKNEQFISHFNSVAKCLNKGGIYIIELDNPVFIFSNPRHGEKPKVYKKIVEKGKIKINVTYKKYAFDLINSIENNELILDINDNGKKLKIVDDSPVRRLTASEIELFIKLNGKFEVMKIIGDLNLNSSINDKNSKKMVAILRRK